MNFLSEKWKDVTINQSGFAQEQKIEKSRDLKAFLDGENTKIITALSGNDLVEIPFDYHSFLVNFNNFVNELRKTYSSNGLDDSFLAVLLKDVNKYTDSVVTQYKAIGNKDNIGTQDRSRHNFHDQLPTTIINYANLVKDELGLQPLLKLLIDCGLNKKITNYEQLSACYSLLNADDSHTSLQVKNDNNENALITKDDACGYNQAVANLALRLSAIMKWQKHNQIIDQLALRELGIDLAKIESLN